MSDKQTTSYAGIDYGMGQSNVDKETGIRYGVISQHSVMSECLDEAEYDYGPPTCGKCGNEAIASDSDKLSDAVIESEWFDHKDFTCVECQWCFWSDEAYGDEPNGWTIDDGEYQLTDCLDSDIFVLKSPYYTYAQFCGPCVPGAGSLDSAITDCHDTQHANPCGQLAEHGFPKVYALGHEWFEDRKAPYQMFKVSDDSEVTA